MIAPLSGHERTMRFSWRKSRNSTLRNILEEILGDRFSYRFDISSAILLAPGKTSNLSFTIFSERDIFISRQKSIGKVKIYLLVCYIPTYSRYSPRGDVINYRTSRRLTSPINYRGKELLFSAVLLSNAATFNKFPPRHDGVTAALSWNIYIKLNKSMKVP